GVSVVIWTTTPWTIPQNRAVAFNQSVPYGLYYVDEVADGSTAMVGERLLLAEALVNSVMKAAKVASLTHLRTVPSDELKGVYLYHPFRGIPEANGEWDYPVPMLPGDHVTDDAGTGFVHTAPSHGDDDYQMGVRFGLK